MKRMILVKGAVETLSYFSARLADAFRSKGIDVMFWDMLLPAESREQFEQFVVEGETGFLTFNFIGLSEEAQFAYGAESVWEHYHIPCFCIMVDHPMYYYPQLKRNLPQLFAACIDRDHERFVREFYPQYRTAFIPLAGSELGEPLPLADRPIDILFCGNYVALSDLERHVQGVTEEYRIFYQGIIDELIAHPRQTMEEAMLAALHREIPDITPEDTLSCLYHMIYIDLVVRSAFRSRLITTLAEAGLTVTVVGKDWEKAECSTPGNIHSLGQQDSLFCLERMKEAKISLNIMPWFKDGAHDRIFNGMLAGCAVVSDSSTYLDEILHEGRDWLTFSLGDFREMPEMLRKLLADPQRMQKMADAGFSLAEREHTWKVRADQILAVWNE